MKTAKPSTQSELEDMSRVLSAACEQKGNKETTESDSLFTKLLGIKQEKVNTCTRCKDIKINNDISIFFQSSSKLTSNLPNNLAVVLVCSSGIAS